MTRVQVGILIFKTEVLLPTQPIGVLILKNSSVNQPPETKKDRHPSFHND